MAEVTTKTYEPDNSLKKGYLSMFVEIIEEFKVNRWLIYQLFKREVFANYRQSFIGVFWAFIMPIASVGTFIILNRSGVFTIGDINAPYPIFAVFGMAFWQLFSTGLIRSSDSLVKAGSMIVKINFSKKALVVASAGQSIVSFSIQIVLVGVLLACYRFAPSVWGLLVPIVMIPMILLTFGLGFIFSLINGIVRDIGNVLAVSMTFFMFLTPVLYVKPETGILAQITRYNPVYYMVSAPRNLILTGTLPELRGFLIAAIASVVIFTVCLIVFHLTETRVAERI